MMFGPKPLPVTRSRCKTGNKKGKQIGLEFECQFSSSPRGGKVANAALPPLIAAVNLQGSFSFAQRGGKVANAGLPPLTAAVKLHCDFSSARGGGKVADATLPPLIAAVNLRGNFSSASRGGKAATAVWLHEYTYKPFLSLSLCHLSPSRRYSYTRSMPVGPISNQMYFIQAGPFSE